MRVGAIESFINWIESKALDDHWSFDATVGYAKHKRELGKSIELRDPNIETRENSDIGNLIPSMEQKIRQTML